LFSGDLSSQKARLKLMLALSLEDSAIEQYFDL
jgi:L-asparaginase/Glu-tRNA(Gln) amidotransferase subunit D